MILSEKKMENVLFDYHIAEGISRFENADSAAEARLLAMVLDKHGITKEIFDSSMVYYMTYADRMYDIYTRLSDRFTNEGRLQGIETGSRAMSFSVDGDTANIWPLEEKYTFTAYVPDNLLRYRIQADSTFREGDRFILSFEGNYLFQDGTRNGTVMFAVRFADDSVATRTKQISTGGSNTLEINDTKRVGVKEVLGYFLQKQQSGKSEQTAPSLRMMILSDIRLIKMHTEEPEGFVREEDKAPADSLQAVNDTLQAGKGMQTADDDKVNDKDKEPNEKINPRLTPLDSKNSGRTSLH